MRNDNTYAKAIADYVSDCISGRNNSVFLKKVIYNDPATIALWSDGTKTIVKAQPGIFLIPRKDLLWLLQRKHVVTPETITTASRDGYQKNQ